MPNRLAQETSPYLLQHANNPVDWYPWGPEALERAKSEDKPILLSIGYSACHWCHVMERESFENEAIAKLMNQYFVNIKVDREERPELDAIYMSAVQAMAGHGGWPLTVFLTPEGAPFYGGTYFPPEDRGNIPGFERLLFTVQEAYTAQKENIINHSRQLAEHLQKAEGFVGEPRELETDVLTAAFRTLGSMHDENRGGFIGPPKFPHALLLEFLLRTYKRIGVEDPFFIVEESLTKMAQGGIYDQLGGGFHRYSTDQNWLVPHFEKMLYDNALLSNVYLHAHLTNGNAMYKRVCQETLDYVLREMTDPAGGFYSSQDADSEGGEGAYYVWSYDELAAILGEDDLKIAGRFYGVRPEGQYEGFNILHRSEAPMEIARDLGVTVGQVLESVERAQPKLLEARSKRVPPATDDKVLTNWNGLMLRSFAEAGAALGRADYLDAARKNARFLLDTMRQDGKLLHSYRAGQAKVNGYLEDYACLADGLLALYEASLDLEWFQAAQQLADEMCARFWDEDEHLFYDTSTDHEQLLMRPKELSDHVVPSGNSMAVNVLLRLSRLTGRADYQQKAVSLLQSLAETMAAHAMSFGNMLSALDFYLCTPQEIAIVGPKDSEASKALLNVVWQHYLPAHVLAFAEPDDDEAAEAIALLEERDMINGAPAAYVCQNFACQLPTTDAKEFAKDLGV